MRENNTPFSMSNYWKYIEPEIFFVQKFIVRCALVVKSVTKLSKILNYPSTETIGPCASDYKGLLK